MSAVDNTDDEPSALTLDPTKLADAANRAAGVGYSLGELELSSACLKQRLDDAHLSRHVRRAAVEEVFRIGSELLADEVGRFDATEMDRPKRHGPALVMQDAWRWIEELLAQPASWVRRHGHPTVARHWTVAGVALTAVMVILVMLGQHLAALAVFCLRLAGSTASGGPSVVSAGTRGTAVECASLARALFACLAGHAADMATIAASAAGLHADGHDGLALIATCGGIVAMYGTTARIAAERSGARITRSIIERCCRNGAVLAALVFAAATGSTIPLVLVGIGAGVYGATETLRVTSSMVFDPRPRRATTVTVDAEGTLRVYSLAVTGFVGATGRRSHTAA